MGLSEPCVTTITKPFSFLSHCKVSCDSPCCEGIFGENNHCICNIDTHTNVDSSTDKATDTITPKLLKLVVIIYMLFASVVQVVGGTLSKCSLRLGKYKVCRYLDTWYTDTCILKSMCIYGLKSKYPSIPILVYLVYRYLDT